MARESCLVSEIPAGDGKIANLFLQCNTNVPFLEHKTAWTWAVCACRAWPLWCLVSPLCHHVIALTQRTSPDFFSSQSVGQFLPPVKRGFIPPGAHAPLSLACWRSTYFFLRCLFDRCLNKFFYCEKSAVRKILWRLERTNARPLKNSNKQREVVAINQANFHWIKVVLSVKLTAKKILYLTKILK